jgi:16S rRNA (adenine1518-N6/adenine1519-N6)-dimethyltransferase
MLPKAKKSFGQNWLVDKTVVVKIINAADLSEGEDVLEIGPGTGLLTKELVNSGARVTAIEMDVQLIEPLREQFGDRLDLIQGDALLVDLPEQYSDYSYKLIANIPYNITSDILRRYLTQHPKPSRMVLMVQNEVALRMVATPTDMSLLSVVCQSHASCKRVTRVPAGAFRPIPKVGSAVVQLDLFDANEKWGIEPEKIISLAKAGFASRRKQLHKNIAHTVGLSSDEVKKVLEDLGLNPLVRAQELSMENWVQLTHRLSK